MRHLAFLAIVMMMYAPAVSAELADPVTTLDQSLFDSEPVEDPPIITPPKAPPLPADPIEKPAEPRVEYDKARLQGLNKVTAETSVFEVLLDTPANFGTLSITLKKCTKSLPEERPENAALMRITDAIPGMEKTTVFSGWMFSSSPSLSALEHPVYDITMLECGAQKKR